MNHSVLKFATPRRSFSNLLNCQVYICARCRDRTIKETRRAPISTSASRTAEKIPFSEKFRRKIWGTDTPPGQADPYTKEPNEKGKDAKELSGLEHIASEDPTIAVGPQLDYVPAETWDGLEHVGGATGWWEEAWDKEHQFIG